MPPAVVVAAAAAAIDDDAAVFAVEKQLAFIVDDLRRTLRCLMCSFIRFGFEGFGCE
jgi:hypothetical protein